MDKVIGADGKEQGPISAEGVFPKKSGLAIAAPVCGASDIVTCVTAPVGLMLGFMARSHIRKSNGRQTGSALATVGIVVSLISMLLGSFKCLCKFATEYQQFTSIACVNNLKQLWLAVYEYSENNQGQCLPASRWCDAIKTNVVAPKVPQCPGVPGQRCGYALNARLEGRKLSEVHPKTVAVFESDAGWDANGGPELRVKSPRHEKRSYIVPGIGYRPGGSSVAFADGPIELITESRFNQLRLEP